MAVTIVALSAALIKNTTNERYITIRGGSSIWHTSNSLIPNLSKMAEVKSPPSLPIAEAYRIGESVRDHLELMRNTTHLGDWTILGIRLSKMSFPQERNWVYVVELQGDAYPLPSTHTIPCRIELLVLMDGTSVYDSKCVDSALAPHLSNIQEIADAQVLNNGELGKLEGGLF